MQKVGEGEHQVIHITAQQLFDRSALLAQMQVAEGEMAMLDSPVEPPLARADEVVRPLPADPRLAGLGDLAGRAETTAPLRAMAQKGHWGTGQGVGQSIEKSIEKPIERLADRSVHGLVHGSAEEPAGRTAGCLVGALVGAQTPHTGLGAPNPFGQSGRRPRRDRRA